MKLNSSCPDVESTNVSIRGRGKLSFGQSLFRSVKSTHILHFPFTFMTNTTFDNHSGCRLPEWTQPTEVCRLCRHWPSFGILQSSFSSRGWVWQLSWHSTYAPRFLDLSWTYPHRSKQRHPYCRIAGPTTSIDSCLGIDCQSALIALERCHLCLTRAGHPWARLVSVPFPPWCSL